MNEIKSAGEAVAADPVAAPAATEVPAEEEEENLAQSCSWWKFWC